MDNNELQKQYESLREKVSRLRNARAVETDIPNKFKLEQQLEEANKELFELEQKIEFIEENKIILNLKGSRNEIHCVFGNRITIGRASTCEFCIRDDSVSISNIHTAILYNLVKNEYWIEDLQSANGTHINGARIEKPTQLFGGDKIRLGLSLSLVFEYNQNDFLSSGVFIHYDSNGEEIVRYIVAPKGKLLIGTNPNEAVRFPKFRDGRSLGSVERKADGFCFCDTSNSEKFLEHNTELLIDFFKIGIAIPSIVGKKDKDTSTKGGSDEKAGDRPEPPDPEPPPPDAIPPYLWKLDIFLGFIVLLAGFISFSCFKPDINQIGSRWVNECVAALKNNDDNGKFWKTPPPHNWSLKSTQTYIFSPDNSVEQNFIKLGVSKNNFLRINNLSLSKDFIQEQNTKGSWLNVKQVSKLGRLELKVDYWSPKYIKNQPVFEWPKTEFLYWHSVITLLLTSFLSGLIRYQLIEHYRNNLNNRYEEFQKKRTKRIFEAKFNLDEARSLAQKGELAQALVIINRLLKSVPRTLPVHNEVLDLKKIISIQVKAGGGAITMSPIDKNDSGSFSSSMNTLKLLYLRILGTPYAYQAPYGLEEVSIGRQRRKQDGSVNVGNDVVIRVPGSDQRSLRISRRHLEIKRIDTEYFVIDKSSGRTKLNGKILPENQPYRLQSGDRLSVADVLTLEVLIRVKMTGSKTNNFIRIDSPNEDQDKILIEASIGDMLTEVSYE